MPIQIVLAEHPQYVQVTYQGTGTPKAIEAHHATVLAHCQAHHQTNCLVDFTQVQMELSITNRYALGRGTQVFGEAGIRVAVVVLPSQIDPSKFAELVAQNIGTQMRVFTQMDEALAWLLAAP